MIDIHNHILPSVDDGSQSLEFSIDMIKKEVSDGVESIILTPHVLSHVSKMSPEDHVKIFHELQDEVKRQNINVNLFLGAEILYRSHLNPDYSKLSLANSKYILIEFSTSIETPIEDIVYDLSRLGFIPIVAHVERYSYLSFEDYARIKNSGGMLQLNGNSILGIDPKVNKKLPMKILKAELADFIATDAHNMGVRIPNLKETYLYLQKHLPEAYLEKLFYRNAKLIIS
ncbi:MAG: CpsB/CapC family capsule biosynthesis tyrosine phosphatase [Acholeplasmataceae bacterium]|nr:CpsB/CapC family capsule biosynthesis tyrosine phosphatase [Acholeplasmataceae bacterium]